MSPRPRLLLVEDDGELRRQLKEALFSHYEVVEAVGRAAAVALVQAERPSLVALDLGLEPSSHGTTEGLAVLEELLAIDPLIKVITMSSGDPGSALQAVQLGAYTHMHKPVHVDVLKDILQRAARLHRHDQDTLALQQTSTAGQFADIIGTSPSMQRIFKMIRRVAECDVPVLLTGESGTGKGLIAQAIHRHSRRHGGPFIAINCGAIPDNLLESELFGHEKGAFTGAHIQRKGRIESAQNGVLFLDEIGELPLPLQVKLLHVLQEQRIVRVGGREDIAVDARIIAATNRNLSQAILEGAFRKDLFYRLQVVTIAVPPLRERGEDIVLLAQKILQCASQELRKKNLGFTRKALNAIQAYDWPGNVREMENRIKRAVVMAVGPRLTSEDLELTLMGAKYEGRTLKDVREAVEKEYIHMTLNKHQWNITKAAMALGISRPTLHSLISRYSIKR
ncbi:MAG TPA: PEP-CTERM-box response regulator transcription factor [Nitrospiraceae bacterium]|nr:PEP-CTERM-box response regulator transcription factor [Nitrospiraceae bacterium]